ncbi:MAG: zinc-dependent alcohol dehydrogenase [Phycisphaerales bacterium]
MKAACWYGKHDIRVQDVPEPRVLNPRDAIIRITSTAICGSDLHLYDGFIPMMRPGDILGHEFMGEVVEVGPSVKNLRAGDRVVVPFTICCGGCFFCRSALWSLCDNTNPSAAMAEKMWGFSTAGLFGYSHLTGGYAGGQAQYARVPCADVGPIKVPSGIPDEQVLFLSDILPTGYQAAEQADIKPGDTVAVWGCGPVGQMAIRSCHLFGAERVIAIDSIPERLRMAEQGGAEPLDFSRHDVFEALEEMTGGLGPDRCIDAVGLEASGHTLDAVYDRIKTSLYLATDRIHALRQAIRACRKGGTVSVPGVYGGVADKVPLGAAFQKGLTFKGGQTHVVRYLAPLLDRIMAGEIDPSFVITHRFPLTEAAEAYSTFQQKRDGCVKVVLDPWADGGGNGNGHPRRTPPLM